MNKHIVFWCTLLVLFTAALFPSCSLLFGNDKPEEQQSSIDSLTLSLKTVTVPVGGMEYVSLAVRPASSQKNADISWLYDENIISCTADNYGAVITGKKAGAASLRVTAGGISTTCIVTVDGVSGTYEEDPYIYSNYSVLELKPGISQKVHVSLYGGKVTDMEGFSWTIDNQDAAEVSPAGQYCIVTAKNEGHAKITVSHPKSAYTYLLYVYVFQDTLTSAYITTAQNIVTMNTDAAEQTLSVDLRNPSGANYLSGFSWRIISEEEEPCITLSANMQNAVVTPVKSGSAIVRVTHPMSAYPLDILIRVVTIVENVYIEPSSTLITLSGNRTETVTAELSGFGSGGTGDPNRFIWEVESPEYIDYTAYGNQLLLSGKKNGASKIRVSHPDASYPREIMVLIRNQEADAIDASQYITTTQNYIRTKVGSGAVDVNIMLSGGTQGDERDFIWYVSETPDDGHSPVIDLETTHGQVDKSRASVTYAFGTAYITPRSPGTAVISIAHPKTLYETEILVKVLPSYAAVDSPLYITADTSLLTLVNGTSKTVTASLSGGAVTASDEDALSWLASDSRISVYGNGGAAHITAAGTGSGVSTITISHPKCESEKRIMVLTADTEAELLLLKALYAEKMQYNITEGDTVQVYLDQYGLTSQQISSIIWTSSNTRIASVEKSGNLTAAVTGRSAGVTRITAHVPNASINSLSFTITVYPRNTGSADPADAPYMLTAEKSIVPLLNGSSAMLSVSLSGSGKTQSDEHSISWNASGSRISLIGSGTSAQVTAVGSGSGVSTVTIEHPKCESGAQILIITADTEEELRLMKALYSSKVQYRLAAGDTEELSLSQYGLTSQQISSIIWTSSSPQTASVEKAGTLTARVTGWAPGTAKITAHVPNSSITPLSFTITVYPQGTSGVDPADAPFVLTPQKTIVPLLNGTAAMLYVTLSGSGKTKADENAVRWHTADSRISLIGSGTSAQVTAVGSGSGVSAVTIEHPKCDSGTQILIITADTEEELRAMKALYASKIQYHLIAGETAELPLSQYGLTDREIESITWSSRSPSIVSVEKGADPLTAVITARRTGSVKVTASVPASEIQSIEFSVTVYPEGTDLDEITKGFDLIITPSTYILSLLNGSTASVTASLSGSSKTAGDEMDILWSGSDTRVQVSGNGPQAVISAAGSGSGLSCVTISHPKAEYTSQILVITADREENLQQIKTLFTQKMQHRLIVGSSQRLTLSHFGLTESDMEQLIWTASNSSILSIERQQDLSASVTALKSGVTTVTARIQNSSIPPVTFTVNCYPEGTDIGDITKREVLWITPKTGIISLLNGTTVQTSVSLYGENKSPSDEASLAWLPSDTAVSVTANGTEAVISAAGKGKAVSTIAVTHPRSESAALIKVITADTPSELSQVKTIYSQHSQYSVTAGGSLNLSLEHSGLTQEELNSVVFTSSSPRIASVEKSGNLTARVTAAAAGIASVTASVRNASSAAESFTFTITVNPAPSPVTERPVDVYLTTAQNVLIFNEKETKTVSVTALGLSGSEKTALLWKADDPSIVSVHANGESASVTALKEGETTVTVSHPKSANTLKIICRAGSKYVYVNPSIPYISVTDDIVSLVKGEQDFMLSAALVNSSSVSGFTFSIDRTDIASLSSSFSTGKCFIKPLSAGQAELTITHPDAQYPKKVILVISNSTEEVSGLTYMTTQDNVVTISEGSRKTVSVSIKNTSAVHITGFTWESSNPAVIGITASGATASLAGNGIGTAVISVRHPSCPYPLELIAICVDPIAAAANPYITTPAPILTLTVSTAWTTINADLVGGSEEELDQFSWTADNSSVAQLYGQGKTARVRAVSAGVATVTVTHPRSLYAMRILLICDEPVQASCSISVPENIIRMKPSDTAKTISANLVNGAADDRYNFRWSLDVFDVVELDYSANIASIKPLQQGEAILTITHPKASYDQQIIIKVSEYTEFAFSALNKTITEGKSTFISMQVPAASMKTHVEYSSDSPLVAAVMGTSAVCQLTGIGAGTATVRAKLIAAATNTVQAEAEMLVSVEKAASDLIYITAPSTIFTMEKGTNRTLSAVLTGNSVIPTDQYNLQWQSTDPAVAQIRGTSSTGTAAGQSVYVEALAAGETTITVSHEKSNTNLVFYIIVPGSDEQSVTLNKTFITLEKGGTTELKATISDGSNDDYTLLAWSVSKMDGVEVVRMLGNGKTVSLYAVASGTVTVRAQLPNGKYALCDVQVEDPKSFSFGQQAVRLQPGETKTVKYTVTPATAGVQWVQSEDTYFTFADNGNNAGDGLVSITGIKEGTSTLTCVTSYGNKATLQVICAWDYAFQLGKSAIIAEPRHDPQVPDKFIIPYTVNPAKAEISVSMNTDTIATYVIDKAKQQIILTPIGEGTGRVTVTAKNPDDNNAIFGTRTCELNFKYNNLTLVTSVISQNGSFSKYDESVNILTLGDGEKVELAFAIAEPNVDYQIGRVTFEKQVQSSPIYVGATGAGNVKEIGHPNDVIVNEYLVTHDTYFTYSGNRLKLTWQRAYYNGSNYYYYAFVGDNRYFVRYESSKGNHSGYKTLICYTTPDGDGTPGTETWSATQVRTPLATPIRVSSTAYFNNTDYYWPAHEQKHSYKSGATWNSYDGTWAAWDINQASLVPVLDNTIQSRESSGYLNVEIVRSGRSQYFQIPVRTEVRNCLFNR